MFPIRHNARHANLSRSLSSLWRRWLRQCFPSAPRPARQRRYLPRLESLEVRLVPYTAVVSTPDGLGAACTALSDPTINTGVGQLVFAVSALTPSPPGSFYYISLPVVVSGGPVDLGNADLVLTADTSSVAGLKFSDGTITLQGTNVTAANDTVGKSGEISATSAANVTVTNGGEVDCTTASGLTIQGNGTVSWENGIVSGSGSATVSTGSVSANLTTGGVTLRSGVTLSGSLGKALLAITGASNVSGVTLGGGSVTINTDNYSFSASGWSPLVSALGNNDSVDGSGFTIIKGEFGLKGTNDTARNLKFGDGGSLGLVGTGDMVTDVTAEDGLGLQLDGTGNTVDALHIDGPGNSLLLGGSGNTLENSDVNGAEVTFTGSDDTLQGNYLHGAHGGEAIFLYPQSSGNTIGGPTAADGNVISCADGNGISFSSGNSGTLIENNYIGTDQAGTAAPDHELTGILIAGVNITGTVITKNLIAGNSNSGIDNESESDLQITGNTIGLGTNKKPLPNGTGITINANNTTIGGTSASDANTIAGNNFDGIVLYGNNNTLELNYIGINSASQFGIGNNADGIVVGGMNNTIGGASASLGNVISGNGGDGIDVTGDNNIIENNLVGTDTTGTMVETGKALPLGNFGDGIVVSGANNTIGGTIATGNVIAGNGGDGVAVDGSGATGDIVAGNSIGTSTAGADDMGNGGNGISLIDVSDVTIGGPNDDQSNVIADSGDDFFSTSVRGKVLPHAQANSNAETLGPDIATFAASGSASYPSGNGIFYKVLKGDGKSQSPIIKLHIGITLAGKPVSGPKGDGILILDGSNFTIGGTTQGTANYIANCGGAGIHIVGDSNGTSQYNTIEGNYIGTDLNGKILANGPNQFANKDGIVIQGDSSNNTIGAADSSIGTPVDPAGNQRACPASNVIAGNKDDGVKIMSGTGNRVSLNTVYANANMGIDLDAGGKNTIDAPTPAAVDGKSTWQDYPILDSVTDNNGKTNVTFMLTLQGNGPYSIEFYANTALSSEGSLSEGQQFIGDLTGVNTGSLNLSFMTSKIVPNGTLPTGLPDVDHLITAIAIDSKGNTSEFSPCRDILRNALNFLGHNPDGGPESIYTNFVPNRVLGARPNLTEAAQDLGVDHFNYEQYIVGASANLEFYTAKEIQFTDQYDPRTLKKRAPPSETDPLLDPTLTVPPNVIVIKDLDPGLRPPFASPPPGNHADEFPYYWNDDIKSKAHLNDLGKHIFGDNQGVIYDDAPTLPFYATGELSFKTILVGVGKTHQLAMQWTGLNTNFTWTSDSHIVSFLASVTGQFQTGQNNASSAPVYGGVSNIQFVDPPPAAFAGDQLVLIGPPQVIAGANFSVTVTAEDSSGNTDASDNGWINLVVDNGPQSGTLTGIVAAPIVNGVATFTNLALNGAGQYTLAAGSDIGQLGTATITVSPTTHFSVTTKTATTAAGSSVTYTITALGSNNQPDPTYQGNIQLTSSDPQASFPGGNTVAFTANDQGAVAVQAILGTAGSQTVTTTDSTLASANGTSSGIEVTPGLVKQFGISAVSSQPAVIGSPMQIEVTAEDAYRNSVGNYTGTISFGVSSGTANLPGSYSFGSTDKGAHSFTITPTSVGNLNLQVTDGTNSGALPIGVVSAATHLVVSVSSTGPVVAGTPFMITVQALDAANKPDPNFQDVLHFAGVGLSLEQAFTSTTGTQQFTVTLPKAGTQTITVTDLNRPAIKGTSSGIAVTAVASEFVLTPPPSAAIFGAPYVVKITAQDANGNPATAYRGTVQLSVTGGTASVPASVTLTSASGTFTVTPQSLGSLTIKATGGSNSGTLPITVVSAATHLAISGMPVIITAGKPFTLTVSALTSGGRPASPFQDVLHFADTAGSTGLPSDAAFTGANGTEQFTITLPDAGPQSLSVSDASLAGVKGATIAVTVQPANNGITPAVQVSGPTVGVPGQPLTFNLTASETGAAPNALYTYHIDWLGNGKSVQVVQGPGSGTPVTFTYPTTGNVTMKVTATDAAGDSGTATGTPVNISTTALENDPYTGTDTALAIGCATSGSTILITPTNAAGTNIALGIGGVAQTLPSQPFTSILVFGQAGNVMVTEQGATIGGQAALIDIPALVFGGSGTNTLSVAGSMANNVLIGGPGKSTLTGGTGRDILIGGGGAATLNAGSGDDIVIAGSTTYDRPTALNLAALVALMSEWQRTDIDYAQRVQDLSAIGSGGANGAFVLDAQTVSADTTASQIVAGAGSDWFWISVNAQKFDQIVGYTDGEVVSLD